MNLLSTDFQRSGWHFEQLFRDGQIAIYFKSLDRTRHCFSYEVIRIQSHSGFEIAGKQIAPGENYPPSTSWGTHGFTFKEYNAATAKAYELVATAKEKAALAA